MTDTDTTDSNSTTSVRDCFRGYAVPGVVAVTTLVLVAADPTAAADICTDSSGNQNRIGEIMSGFFQLTTALGLVGLVLVWQSDALASLFTLNTSQKRGLKRHKNSAMKAALVLLLLGPLVFALSQTANLPLGGCAEYFQWF